MRRMFRAAGIAAAVALYAVTSFAAPASAQDGQATTSQVSVPISSSIAASGNVPAALYGPRDPAKPIAAVASTQANAPASQASPFSQMFGHAVQAIGTIEPRPLQPQAPQGQIGQGQNGQPQAGAQALGGQRPLSDLVISYVAPATIDAQQECLASAIYFEARSEPLEGQLAVAQVVLNRAASGRFPPDVCAVVTQPAQFSFVHRGRIPAANRNCDAWHRALAIAQVARERLFASIPSNVLWYHASYVSPGWGQRLVKTTQIGLHIFYS